MLAGLMRAVPVVMAGVLAKHALEVPFAVPGGSPRALCDCRAWRRVSALEPFRDDGRVADGEFGVVCGRRRSRGPGPGE